MSPSTIAAVRVLIGCLALGPAGLLQASDRGAPAAPAEPRPLSGRNHAALAQEPHARAAAAHAERHYRTAYKTPSPSVRVTRIECEVTATERVPGTNGRYRVSGRAHLVLYDERAFGYSRTTSLFEAITEHRENETKVVSFSVKS